MPPARRSPAARRATTLAELLVVLAIIALVAALVLPSLKRGYDRIATRGAARDVMMSFFTARSRAIDDARLTTVLLDGASGRVVLVAAGETLLTRRVGVVHGVTLSASRPATTYFPDGVGRGGANLSIVLTRGAAVETVLVSREGRVKLGAKAR